MLSRVYNLSHTPRVQTPGERLRELMEAVNHNSQTLAVAIGASDRAVRTWLKKTNSDPPPRSPKHRAALAKVLGEDVFDRRPKLVASGQARAEADDLEDLRFLDATELQHAERLARMLAERAQSDRPQHDQSNVVPVDWSWEQLPDRAVPQSPTRAVERADAERELFNKSAEGVDVDEKRDEGPA